MGGTRRKGSVQPRGTAATGIEIRGQRANQLDADHVWITTR
jgi:hypothetical protein